MVEGLDADARLGGNPLVSVVRQLALARSATEVHRVVGRAARRMVRSDGSALTIVDGRFARHCAEEGTSPGWTGRSIPLSGDVTGWCVSNGRPVVVADVRADIRLPVAPFWSTPVTSLTAVPIRSRQPIGALIVYWAYERVPDESDIDILQALADSAALAVENIAVRASMEQRVKDRTNELEELNARLQREIDERRRAEEEVRQMSLVDELTGLYNRRGFNLLAGRELRSLQRTGRRGLVLYIDLDGLKQANDTKGHEAGDRLLQRAAGVLRAVARETDVAARLGGDEFAVFMTVGYDHPPLHLIVERFLDGARHAGIKWSIGAAPTPLERVVTLDDLLTGADEAMYRGRRARRGPKPVAVSR